jgi:multicomponent Na+:H+ antiporter subunit E
MSPHDSTFLPGGDQLRFAADFIGETVPHFCTKTSVVPRDHGIASGSAPILTGHILISTASGSSICGSRMPFQSGTLTMAPSRPASILSGGFFWLWALLTFLWFAANSSLAIESVATGASISVVLAFIFTRKPSPWRDARLSPERLLHFGLYTSVFCVELIRANINMMRYVYAPRIKIKPGIVKITTKLKTPIGRLFLANSIALTPGSLVIDIDKESLFVHWLDVKTTEADEATRAIAGAFEEHLEKAFG